MARRTLLALAVTGACAWVGCATAPAREEAAPAATRPAAPAPATPAPAAPEPRSLLALADAHVAARRFDEAIAVLDRAAVLGEDAAVRAARGRALGLARRFDEAARDLGRALELDPRRSATWAVLAAVELNRGDQVAADRAFSALTGLAGKNAAADQVWTQLLAMAPDPVAPQETLDRCTRGVAAGMAGEWLEAERELRNGLKYAPRHAWCLAQWAESVGRSGDLVRAEAAFREAIAAFPQAQAPLRADAEGRLAALLVSSRRNAAEAVRLARGALDARGDRAALLFVLGRACELADDAACVRDAYGRMLVLPHVPATMRAGAEEQLRLLPASARGH